MITAYEKTIKEFNRIFDNEPTHYFEIGGRLELIGNHTDHNRGKCLVAGCSLGLFATVKKSEDNIVHIVANGFDEIYVDLDSLNGRAEEFFTSKAIVRGVAAKMVLNKHKIGGFDAYIESTIFAGAGASSSAALNLSNPSIFTCMLIIFPYNQFYVRVSPELMPLLSDDFVILPVPYDLIALLNIVVVANH